MRCIITRLHFHRDLVVWLRNNFFYRNLVRCKAQTAKWINLCHIAIEYCASMKLEWISRLEQFLERNDFGKNWDGAYQDAVPTLRQFFIEQVSAPISRPNWHCLSGIRNLYGTR